ncbi:hypothetical protein CSC2_41030 [Clostridium zeae]|uniref:Uncharacterized protein n=1 Tax=Clostridium zeae TaxID=2759022 RepID=A0ABQ1EFI2_9CLOT|nr:hypothetical protein [Clostridium zeae]GFZ33577.1 hypothetical protein CSC2_41030 [Clostridium zeae]
MKKSSLKIVALVSFLHVTKLSSLQIKELIKIIANNEEKALKNYVTKLTFL